MSKKKIHPIRPSVEQEPGITTAWKLFTLHLPEGEDLNLTGTVWVLSVEPTQMTRVIKEEGKPDQVFIGPGYRIIYAVPAEAAEKARLNS